MIHTHTHTHCQTEFVERCILNSTGIINCNYPKHRARKTLQSFHTWHSSIYLSGKTSLVYWEKEENTSSAWWPLCKNPLPPPAACYLISNLVFSFPCFKVIHHFLLMFTGGGGDKHLSHVFSKVLSFRRSVEAVRSVTCMFDMCSGKSIISGKETHYFKSSAGIAQQRSTHVMFKV